MARGRRAEKSVLSCGRRQRKTGRKGGKTQTLCIQKQKEIEESSEDTKKINACLIIDVTNCTYTRRRKRKKGVGKRTMKDFERKAIASRTMKEKCEIWYIRKSNKNGNRDHSNHWGKWG